MSDDLRASGPRLRLPGQTRLIEERRARGVFAGRPWITGRVELAGRDMSTPVEDAVWARSPDLADYLRLVLLTVVGKGRGDAIRN